MKTIQHKINTKKLQPGSVASRDHWHENGEGLILIAPGANIGFYEPTINFIASQCDGQTERKSQCHAQHSSATLVSGPDKNYNG